MAPDSALSLPAQEKTPLRLALAFSRAADEERINALFSSSLKTKIDPAGFVAKRCADSFNQAVQNGRCAFLYDQDTGDVYTITLSYHIHDTDRSEQHSHAEIGTSLTRLAGFGSAQIVIAALALKEYQTNPPAENMIAKIRPSNERSLKLYRDVLGWDTLTDPQQAARLRNLCNRHLDPSSRNNPATWLYCAPRTIETMAQRVLSHLDRRFLENRETGARIFLDLSALSNSAGLPRTRLENLAKNGHNMR